MQLGPVWTATRPAAATSATLRNAAGSPAAVSLASASDGSTPSARRSSNPGPYDGSPIDCVATAPTAGRAPPQSQAAPNQRRWGAARRPPGDDRADAEPVRLDGDAHLARVGVTGDDRVGALAHRGSVS